ncbi:MAG: PLDc N-terminal domain-containing protein [bacterium]
MEQGAIFSGIFMIFFFGFFCIFALLCTAFWIWMLIDCVTKETDEGNNRLIWIIVIVLTGAIGGLIYYFVRRQPRIKANPTA